jgi:hypothetical protein
MNRTAALAVVFSLTFAGLAFAEEAGDKVLARLRGLAGTWEGTFEWSGARTGSGKARATYEVTGNGSAVVEHLFMNDQKVASMTSAYHLDGADLRMTHYCAAGNQPRLKATRIAEGESGAQFSFVDATNLASRPAHVEAFEIRFPAPDRLVLRFTFDAAGKKSVEHIELKRAG